MKAFYVFYDPYKDRDFLTYPYIPGELLIENSSVDLGVSLGPFLPVPLASVKVKKDGGRSPVVNDINGRKLILTVSVGKGLRPWSGNAHERNSLVPEENGDHLNALVYLTVSQLGYKGKLSTPSLYEFPRKGCGDAVQILGEITWDTTRGGWSMGSCEPPNIETTQMAVTLLLVLEPERTASFYFDTPLLPTKRRWVRLLYSGFSLTSVVVKE